MDIITPGTFSYTFSTITKKITSLYCMFKTCTNVIVTNAQKNLLQQPRKYCLNPLHPARCTQNWSIKRPFFLSEKRVLYYFIRNLKSHSHKISSSNQKLVSEGKAWVTFAESLFRCSHWGSTRQYGTSSPADCRTLFRLSFDILIWQLSNHNYILSP